MFMKWADHALKHFEELENMKVYIKSKRARLGPSCLLPERRPVLSRLQLFVFEAQVQL